MQETWHVKAREKGHLLVCPKRGNVQTLAEERIADALQYTSLFFLTADLGR